MGDNIRGADGPARPHRLREACPKDIGKYARMIMEADGFAKVRSASLPRQSVNFI